MPVTIDQTKKIEVRESHKIRVIVDSGINDDLRFYLDGDEIVKQSVGTRNFTGSTFIEIDEVRFEFKWAWNPITGKPSSIWMERDNKTLMLYGDKPPESKSLGELIRENRVPFWGYMFAAACAAMPITTYTFGIGARIDVLLGGVGAIFSIVVAANNEVPLRTRIINCIATVVFVWGIFGAIYSYFG